MDIITLKEIDCQAKFLQFETYIIKKIALAKLA